MKVNRKNITSQHYIFETALSRIIEGYTAIEHEVGTFPMQKDIIQLISQSGVYYTPTYIVRPGVKNIYVDNTSIEKQKLLYLNGNILFNYYYITYYES